MSRARSASVVESGFWDLGLGTFPITTALPKRATQKAKPRFQFAIPNPRALVILKEASVSGMFDDQSVVGIWDLGLSQIPEAIPRAQSKQPVRATHAMLMSVRRP